MATSLACRTSRTIAQYALWNRYAPGSDRSKAFCLASYPFEALFSHDIWQPSGRVLEPKRSEECRCSQKPKAAGPRSSGRSRTGHDPRVRLIRSSRCPSKLIDCLASPRCLGRSPQNLGPHSDVPALCGLAATCRLPHEAQRRAKANMTGHGAFRRDVFSGYAHEPQPVKIGAASRRLGKALRPISALP